MANAAAKQYTLLFQLQAALGPNFKRSFSDAQKSTKNLQTELTNLKKSQRDVSGLQKTERQLRANTEKLESYKKELKDLEEQQKKTGGSSERLNQRIINKKEQIAQTTDKIKKETAAMGEYQEKLKEAGIDTQNLTAESRDLERQIDRIGESQKRLASIGAEQAQIKNAISSTKGELAKTVGGVAAVATPVYAGPVKSAMKLESGMAGVAKVVDGLKDKNGKATESYREMEQQFQKLSETIPMSTSELMEIAQAAGQAGIGKDDIVGFTEQASKMSVAFGTSADEAGDWMATWRTAFGMTQKEVNTLSDQINYLGNTSSATAPQIANIVTQMGPLGKVAGLSEGQIAALGATLVSSGVEENKAATGIKTLITTMTAGKSATKAQSEALKQMGFSSTELAQRMQTDATGAVLDLLKAIKKLPKAAQTATLNELFGKAGVGTLAPLLNNLDILEQKYKDVGDTKTYAGSVDTEFGSQAGTTENQIKLVKNSFKTLNETIGKTFLPQVANVANHLKKLFTKIQEWASKNPKIVKGITKVAGAMAGMKIGWLITKLGILNVKKGILDLKSVVETLKLGKLATGGKAIKGLMGGFGGKLTAIIAIVGGIVALVKIIQSAGLGEKIIQKLKEGGPIAQSFAGVLEKLHETNKKIFSALQDLASTIGPPIWDLIKKIGSALKTVGETIIPPLLDGIGGIIEVIGNVVETVAPIIGNAIRSIGEWFARAFQAVKGAVEKIKGIFSGIIDFITGDFAANWEQAWNGIKGIFGSIFEGLKDLAKAPINAVIGIVNKGIEKINSVKVPNWVPFVGGKGPNIGKIKKLATGSAHTPETFIAGENGPELVTEAPGRKVYTNKETENLFSRIAKAAKESMQGRLPEKEIKKESIRRNELTIERPITLIKPEEIFTARAESERAIETPTPRIQPALATAGGPPIVINSQPIFNIQNGGDAEEIDKTLQKNNEKLKQEIWDEIKDKEQDNSRRRY